RARAFAAGTIAAAAAAASSEAPGLTVGAPRTAASGDAVAARAHATDAATVLQGYLHAAALTGRTIEHVMAWVCDPLRDSTAEDILARHPHAAPHWDGLLRTCLREPATVATVQAATGLFLHRDVAARCLPGRRRPATDLADVI